MGVTSAEETTPHARTAAARQMAAPWSDVTTSVKVGKQMTRVASVEGMVLDVRGAMVFQTQTQLLDATGCVQAERSMISAVCVVGTAVPARTVQGFRMATKWWGDATATAVARGIICRMMRVVFAVAMEIPVVAATMCRTVARCLAGASTNVLRLVATPSLMFAMCVEATTRLVRGAMVFPTATKLLMRAMYVVETRRRARAAMGCPTAARHSMCVGFVEVRPLAPGVTELLILI